MSKLKIFVAGHKGMVGSALVHQLKDQDNNIIVKDKSELNLIDQQSVQRFFQNEKFDQVYLAAAKVGGIYANNTYPAEFIYQNLMIQSNVIHSSFLSGVKKLLFLGSSCAYPKNATQPIKENELLSGKLEPTNEPYAIAKIAGIKMCESYNRQYGKSHNLDYRCVMLTNTFGPNDNYHPQNSHVIPSLIYRFHEAKIKNLKGIKIWGTGKPKREFLYVDDVSRACIFIMNLEKKIYDRHTLPMCNSINIGSGKDLTIKELAEIIKEVVGFDGEIKFDSTKPDGIYRKLLDNQKINNFNFKPEVSLKNGLTKTYEAYLKIYEKF